MARSQSRGVGPPGAHRTRTGKVITRLRQRRLVAVLGDIEALKPRLWLEAVRQGISTAPRWSGSVMAHGAYGGCMEEQLAAAVAVGILDFYRCAVPVEGGRRLGWTAHHPGVSVVGWARRFTSCGA